MRGEGNVWEKRREERGMAKRSGEWVRGVSKGRGEKREAEWKGEKLKGEGEGQGRKEVKGEVE